MKCAVQKCDKPRSYADGVLCQKCFQILPAELKEEILQAWLRQDVDYHAALLENAARDKDNEVLL